jgi:hypothetical protein
VSTVDFPDVDQISLPSAAEFIDTPMHGDLSSSNKLERLQRAGLLLLVKNLNAMIDAINAEWATRDTDFFTAIGRPRQAVVVEHVAPEHFYPGHKPSLMQSPIENYPNCSVMAYQANARSGGDDHGQQFDLRFAAEILVRSIVDEEECNCRIQRTVDAVHRVMLTDRTLGGAFHHPWEDFPAVTNISDVFVRYSDENGRGDRWYWQGGRLEFVMREFCIIPGGR